MKNRIVKKDKPNSRRIQNGLFCAASIGIAMISGCGDKKHNDDNKNFNGGGGGQSLQTVTADFSGAVGVLVIDSSQSGSLRLNGFANESMSLADSGSNDTSLVKVDNQGDIKSALSTAESDSENGGCCQQPLPRIKTIAVSPNKEIYLHFERPFVYKAPDSPEGWSKANDPVNGYQCQIFKVKGGDLDDLRVNPPDPSAGNLECLDSEHFVDSWQAQRNSVFQFDKDSNVYYPGSLPNGGGKMVVYKRTADGTTSEVINSNICVQDFLVAKSGGVFYTGTSKCDGSGGGSGGFFRYVSPSSSVIEIARDWWNFVFEPISTSSADKAVFFGPDPRSSTTASWNSACLFAFDPAGGSSASDRINNVITCGADIWSWIQMTRTEDVAAYGSGYQNGNSSPSNAWITEFKSRCESSGKVFAGGGSQISAIKQTSDGATYVIGQVQKKKAGELTCSLSIKGPHCYVNSKPYLPDSTLYGTSTLCQAAGGTWTEDDGNCSANGYTTRSSCRTNSGTWNFREVNYGNIASDYCGEGSSNTAYAASLWNTTVADSNGTVSTKFSRGWLGCQVKESGSTSGGGQQWTDEYKALAKVDTTTKTLSLLSGTDEQAINLWLVNDVPYYSSFNSTKGRYYLKRWDTTTSSATAVAENFEAYNLSTSKETGKLYYDGLDFSSNSYSFGTMLEASPYTRTIKTGLTGTVKTIVILPQ